MTRVDRLTFGRVVLDLETDDCHMRITLTDQRSGDTRCAEVKGAPSQDTFAEAARESFRLACEGLDELLGGDAHDDDQGRALREDHGG